MSSGHAVALYAMLARDVTDFIDELAVMPTSTLDTLHLMLTTPNDKHDHDTKELNAIGARLVERAIEKRKGQ